MATRGDNTGDRDASEMIVSTPTDLGALIRQRRKMLGLSQDSLDALSGVSHKFLNEVEQGKQTAQIGKVMRVIEMLGIDLVAKAR